MDREKLLNRADKVWANPTYDDLLDLVKDLVWFIEHEENRVL